MANNMNIITGEDLFIVLSLERIDELSHKVDRSSKKKNEQWMLLKRQLILGLINHVCGFPYQEDGTAIVIW